MGVVWHTTGSGKSYTMIFTIKQLLEKIKPLIIVLTDRLDLDGQIFNTLSKSKSFLNVDNGLKQITSRENLISELKDNTKPDILTTTLQKFSKNENNLEFETLSNRDDIFIIVDEAHRSQYDLKDGLAKNLRDALPNAKFLGFTGTPIELEDKNTKLIFGDYIDKYIINRAVEDKTTVPIHYEPRLAKINLKEDQIKSFDKKVEKLFEESDTSGKDKDFLKMEAIIGNEKRLKTIAEDFLNHFKVRFENSFGKVMFVCISRKIAVKFYEILESLEPKLFNDNDKLGQVKLVMSGSSSDSENFQKHIRTKEQTKEIEKRFKDEKDELKIAIVSNMWLTGFDIPCLNTLYIDKPIKDHTLIQAISRVNRVYKDKDFGLVVDYIGIGDFLKKALFNFSNEDKKEIEIDFEKVITKLLEYYELTKSNFNGFDYDNYFTCEDKKQRDEIIKEGIDKILRNEKYKKSFLENSLKLIKTFSLCPLSIEAKKIVNEINYFKLVRIGILNFSKTTKKIISKHNLDYELSKIVSNTIETQGVVNIYDFVGIKKPEVSLLDENFFNGIRNLKQKNLAYELLKKVLEDNFKEIKKNGNITKEKKFSEKLRQIIAQYQNQTLESAKVIEEMIELAKSINKDIEEKKNLGLSEDEINFYDAVSSINDKKEVMETEILKDLTKELVVKIRKNKTIDWDKRESAKAKMRLMIKKLLKKYKYPPEGMEKAKELVLEQAKVFCESI